ncbi:MAG: J-domain-containing protein [Anaerolineales bacterium]
MDFDKIIEKILRQAQAEGKFDNLSGQGKPLKLDHENEASEEWAANHLLKNQNLRPAWLEEDVAIRDELEGARTRLQRTYRWHAAEMIQLSGKSDEKSVRQWAWAEEEWKRVQTEFRETVKQLNQRIRLLNLKVPSDQLQRIIIDADAELAKACR